MKTVFILGAGASKLAGAPLMVEFFEEAEKLLNGNKLSEDERKSFEDVFSAKSHLRQVVQDKSDLDLTNLEHLFGAIEMAEVIGKFCDRDEASIQRLNQSLRLLIVRTLQETMPIPYSNKQYHAQAPYGDFAKLLSEINKRGAGSESPKVSVLTFNYDTALEFAFYNRGQTYDYCLESTNNNSIAILKLHGSINWSFCNTCKKITPILFGRDIKLPSPIEAFDMRNICLKYIETIQKQNRSCSNSECKNPDIDEMPLIVPPTWNKTMYHSNLSAVWKKAARELSDAVNIVIIGYSFPESDMFFRYLFALGTISRTELKKFWVVDTNPEVKQRYKEIVGRAIERNAFEYFEMNFASSIKMLESKL